VIAGVHVVFELGDGGGVGRCHSVVLGVGKMRFFGGPMETMVGYLKQKEGSFFTTDIIIKK
jgi:hypothetical protein